MRRRDLSKLAAAALLFSFLQMTAYASGDGGEDTYTRMVDARVVEVTEHRVSVIARTGVEHVIAVNISGTKVLMKGKAVSLTDLREGDVVTIELDEANPLKFAKQIRIASQAGNELANAVP